MGLSIYLLRHGETTHSQTGGYCGALNPELTPAGMEMAQAFADAYGAMDWTAVFTSPMKRTMATAKPLCEALGMTPQLREGLKELQYGAWEDRSQDEVKQLYGPDYNRWMTEPAWNPPTGGETSLQIASRANTVIAEIKETYETGNVLVVSHKATIRIIICSLLGIDLGRYRDRIEMPVASLSVIKFGRYGPMLQRLGDRNHLPEALRKRAGT
ncbi:histidine phosphatase family protein [Leptolyngbyaceae cyanobacterium CCMR0082]|uniref:Histidine phosphatase family protein n=1 Tax=Adonisia turfae CCMR0082 TaxID=2304604 RepID=A0A6M0S1Q1_9CYAN|nr:histidine phosphatase family protein [Adonisia turfae]NEZ62170.1 histidine phosphatase family protein [Adonisia turfae CCMR0082]